MIERVLSPAKLKRIPNPIIEELFIKGTPPEKSLISLRKPEERRLRFYIQNRYLYLDIQQLVINRRIRFTRTYAIKFAKWILSQFQGEFESGQASISKNELDRKSKASKTVSRKSASRQSKVDR